MTRPVRFALIAVLVALPALGQAYPGGTPGFVTDVAPYCAGCHSSVSADQFVGVPESRVSGELAANKHIAKIEAATEGTPYADLGEAERKALIEGIRKIDAAASVRVIVPEGVKAGSVIEVSVEATGGGGPVVGLALVDSNQRWQASPAPSRGWLVVDTPVVHGPDGSAQTRFTENRNKDLAQGISYVNVYGVRADTVQGKYDSVRVTWRLRAPAQPGSYPLAAAFLYGTEKGAPHGAVEQPGRGPSPIGGFLGNAGRVRFSDVLKIAVQ